MEFIKKVLAAVEARTTAMIEVNAIIFPASFVIATLVMLPIGGTLPTRLKRVIKVTMAMAKAFKTVSCFVATVIEVIAEMLCTVLLTAATSAVTEGIADVLPTDLIAFTIVEDKIRSDNVLLKAILLLTTKVVDVIAGLFPVCLAGAAAVVTEDSARPLPILRNDKSNDAETIARDIFLSLLRTDVTMEVETIAKDFTDLRPTPAAYGSLA